MPSDSDHSDDRDDRAARLRGLRRKLAKLNRRPVEAEEPDASPRRPVPPAPRPPQPPGMPPNTIVFRRDLPRVAPARATVEGGICIPLERCIEGTEAHCPRGVPYFLIERSVRELEPDGPDLHEALARALDALAQRRPRKGREPVVATPDQVTFLDLETTGLGSSPVFLIGTLLCRDREVVARLFLARNYAEELAILDAFAEDARARPVFVTFNGKTFDVPYLRVRAVATGAPFCEPRLHLDLLHASRRVYKGRLPDCKLQTLERYVCRRDRGHDIPGSDIPRAYHDFVRRGDARELAQIVEHNLHDLVTMVHLMARLFVDTASAQ